MQLMVMSGPPLGPGDPRSAPPDNTTTHWQVNWENTASTQQSHPGETTMSSTCVISPEGTGRGVPSVDPSLRSVASWPRCLRGERILQVERMRTNSEPTHFAVGHGPEECHLTKGFLYRVVDSNQNTGRLDLPCEVKQHVERVENTTDASSMSVDENMNISTMTVGLVSCQSSGLPGLYTVSPVMSAFIDRPELKDGEEPVCIDQSGVGTSSVEPLPRGPESVTSDPWYIQRSLPRSSTFRSDNGRGGSRQPPVEFTSQSKILERSSVRERSPVHPVVHTLPRTKSSAASCNTSYVFVPISFTDFEDTGSEDCLTPPEQAGPISNGVGSLHEAETMYNHHDKEDLHQSYDEQLEWSEDRGRWPGQEVEETSWSVDQEVAMATCPEEEQEEEEIICLDLEQDEEDELGTSSRPGNPVADTLDSENH